MDSLPTLLQKKLGEGVTDPHDLGRVVAKIVPRNWKISIYVVVKAGIPKGDHKAVFSGFIEEQGRKFRKFKGKGSKKSDDLEVDDGPEQLDMWAEG